MEYSLMKVCLFCGVLGLAAMSEGFRVRAFSNTLNSMGPRKQTQDDKKLFFKSHIPDPVTKARLGQGLVLDCEAGGSPTPTVHWLFKGSRIPQTGSGSQRTVFDDDASYENTPNNEHMHTLRLGSTKSKLYMDCVSPADVGSYACVAETPYRRIVTTTQLSIESSLTERLMDSCIMKRLETGLPARIYMWTAQRLEFEGADVQLFCRGGGNPAPTVHWYDQEGREIGQNDEQYTKLDNGDLLIKSVNWDDNMGVYKCVVENSKGRDEVATFLYPVSQGQGF